MSAKPYPSRPDPSLTETTRRRVSDNTARWPHDLSHPRERRMSFCPVPWHWPDPNPMPRFHLFTRRTR